MLTSSHSAVDDKTALEAVQRAVWAGSVPLEIRLDAGESRTFDETESYLVSECDCDRDGREDSCWTGTMCSIVLPCMMGWVDTLLIRDDCAT